MTDFAGLCGLDDEARRKAGEEVLAQIGRVGIERVRMAWCDLHGITRGKTLMAGGVARALQEGVGLVGTLMLKDTSDRTAFKVFEPGGMGELAGFAGAANLMLMPDPASFRQLPWAPGTAWMQGQLWHQDGGPVELDTRRILQHALARLGAAGFEMRCGLEVEFHIYRVRDRGPQLDPETAAWPGLPPLLELVHPGYNLLSESWWDMAEEPLRIVQQTAQGLGLPLLSLEVELGPSQVEAVFKPTDALAAADSMVLFRAAVKQALQRAGYFASFVCRPPFANIMSSGWHLHQSLVHRAGGGNAFRRDAPAPRSTPADAAYSLSDIGEHYLAGLLEHARAMAVFCTPTVNGFARFQPNALAPQSVLWGRDNRGAMLRVIGACGDPATRIENRIGEPAANPYLYFASQIHSGLDGIERKLALPRPADTPYEAKAEMLPHTLEEALEALDKDKILKEAMGPGFVDYYCRIKQAEIARFNLEVSDWEHREYFDLF
jgi:glutamine synthetase